MTYNFDAERWYQIRLARLDRRREAGEIRDATRDVLLERMHFADLEVQFLPEDVENLPDLTRGPGVRAVERRLVLPGTVFVADHARINGSAASAT